MTTARRPRGLAYPRGEVNSDVNDWVSFGARYLDETFNRLHDELVQGHDNWAGRTNNPWIVATRKPATSAAQSLMMPLVEPTEELRHRLDNANDYFRRKASEVFTDDDALRLLAAMHQSVFFEIADFNPCQHGLALAKLTAANFAEIGASIIYITESGQRFIEGIENA